jgi:hypothetical protein
MVKKGNGGPYLVLALLFLLFAVVGVSMGVFAAGTIITHLQARQWHEVPARIVRAELKTHFGRSTSYEATAEYVYFYQGRQYTSTRVGLQSGGDSLGSFQQDAYRRLSEHQKSGKPFPCYVNPQRPDEAILLRELRWEMLTFQTFLALVFGGIGFGLAAAALTAGRGARTEAALAAAHPDTPWLWKPDWAEGKIVDSGKAVLGYVVGFAIFWNLISTPLGCLALANERIGRGNRLALLSLVFPLVGLLLIAWAVMAALRYRRFGWSVFQMASVPGVVGGQLAGVIRTAAKVWPPDGFCVTLSCIQRLTTGSGRRRNTSENVLWQDERLVAHELLGDDPTRSAVPVMFDIPYASPPTSESDSTQISWRLSVSAKVPGLDYNATFDVPVFKTPQSDPNFVADDRAIAAYLAPADPVRELREAGVIRTTSPEGDGQRFTFPMARNAGSAAAFSAVGLTFTGATVLLLYWGVYFFTFVFALVDLAMLWAAVDQWLFRSQVDISRRGLAVRSGWLRLGRRRWIEASEIAKFGTGDDRQWSGSKIYLDVVAIRRDGQQIKLGKRLPGARVTAALIGQMEYALRG